VGCCASRDQFQTEVVELSGRGKDRDHLGFGMDGAALVAFPIAIDLQRSRKMDQSIAVHA
jgi:hypothetical protein